MELWDVYDGCMEKTGRTHVRGEKMPEGDHHIVVMIYPVNDRGEILIQKRSAATRNPLRWAETCGSAIMGETAAQAMRRELSEELGLCADAENTELLSVEKRKASFLFTYIMRTNADISELRLQEEEVAEAKWVTADELTEMIDGGEFLLNEKSPVYEILEKIRREHNA